VYEEEIDLRIYIDVLLRRRRLILTLTLGMAVLALGISFLLPPVYETQAALAVAPRRSNITLTEDFVLSEEEIKQLAANQRAEALTEIAKSLKVAQTVLKTYPHLDGEDTTPNALVQSIEVSIKNDLLVINASANSPQKAAELATAWAEVTRDQINTIYAFDPTIVAEIQTEMDKAWETYRAAQEALEVFLRESDIAALESRISIVDQMLKAYEQAAAESTTARYTAKLQAQQERLTNLYNEEINVRQYLIDAHTLSTQLARSGSVTDTWGTTLALINLQTQAFGKPSESSLQFDLSGTPPSFNAAAVEQVVTSLEEKLLTVEAQIAALSEEVGQIETAAAPMAEDSAMQAHVEALTEELSTLQSQLEAQQAQETQLTEARDVAWTTYKSLSNKQRELKVQASVAASEARLAFEAVPPAKPTAPNKKLNTAVAGALGLMLSVFGAFILEYLVPTPPPDAKRDFVTRWLLTEAPGLPNFDPEEASKPSTHPPESQR